MSLRPGERNARYDEAWSEFVLQGVKRPSDVLASHLAKRTAVYAIGREYLPPIKIGFSSRPKGRLMEMQIGSPDPLKFHFVCWVRTKADATKLEAACHKLLHEHNCHVKGEWFDLDPKGARLAIDGAAATAGCHIIPHRQLTETFRLSNDPLEGCFWE
jgi:hypothetical protein